MAAARATTITYTTTTFSSPAEDRSGRSTTPATRLAANPATAQNAPSPSISRLLSLRVIGPPPPVGDDVDVDPVGLAQNAGDDRLADQLLPAGPVRLAEHDLGDGQLPGGLDDRLGDVTGPGSTVAPSWRPSRSAASTA